MFNPDSPLLNFPNNMDKKQVFYLDGLRHALEIIELSFSRLTNSLNELVVQHNSKKNQPQSYAHIYLDAWAFVDALDRLIALWKLQPNSKTILGQFNPDKLKESMKNIRHIRNVSDHLAQRADQIISSNSSALGELSWITVININPPEMKSCFIRPGVLSPSVNFTMNVPKQNLFVKNETGNVLLKAHTHTANLSESYRHVLGLAEFIENSLENEFRKKNVGSTIGGDLFAICDLSFDQ